MKLFRYFVSAVGLIIGVAIAIVILGVAEGGWFVLKDSFWNDGLKIYEIELSDKGSSSGYLHWDDRRLLEDEILWVKHSIPVLEMESLLKSYKASDTSLVLAVNTNYQKYSNLKILKGRFINDQDVRSTNRIVVLDEYTAMDLFGTTDIVGQKLEIQVGGKNVEFIICGIVRNYNRKIDTLFNDEYTSICYIPDSVAVYEDFNYKIDRIVALIDGDIHEKEAEIKLEHLLEREHGIEDVYNIKEYKQLNIVKEFIDDYLISAVMISALSFLLGGIGIMNIVLLTIQERRKEIGLYKLFGSGIKELQYEIIFKVLILSLGCGIIGLMFGLILGNIIGSLINIKVRLTLMSIFIAVTFPTITGVLSTLYPVLKINSVDIAEIIWEE